MRLPPVATASRSSVAALWRSLLLMLALAGPVSAQPAPNDSLSPSAPRSCARVICELTLETETLKGTYLQVGQVWQTGVQIPLGLLRTRVVRHLSVMPEAPSEAQKARKALTERVLVGVAALVGVATIATYAWKDRLDGPESDGGSFLSPRVSLRIAAVSAVVASGIIVANWRARVATRHLRESVRQYNEQLPR
jgi:hypothetical protein